LLERNPTAEDRALRLMGLAEYQLSDNFILGFSAQLLDNKFSGPGFSALIDFLQWSLSDRFNIRFERVFFSNNYCWHWSVQEAKNTGSVNLRGRSAIVMGNHIKANTNMPSVNFNNIRGAFIGNDTTGGAVQFSDFPAPQTGFNL
jgi:hypothetical protein